MVILSALYVSAHSYCGLALWLAIKGNMLYASIFSADSLLIFLNVNNRQEGRRRSRSRRRRREVGGGGMDRQRTKGKTWNPYSYYRHNLLF